MRVLGLDFGERRIGVAITDPLGITAQGLEVIPGTDLTLALERIKEICGQYEVEEIVVGLPLRLDGSRGPAAEGAERFRDLLGRATELPVKMVDERLSSKAAEKVLLAADVRRKKRKGIRDKLAAVLILDTYLGRIKRNGAADVERPDPLK